MWTHTMKPAFKNVAAEASRGDGKSSLEGTELCQGKLEGRRASAIPESWEQELEKLAHRLPFPSPTVVWYSLFPSVAGFQRCRQQDFCRFLWQSVSQPIRPLLYYAYEFSSLLHSVVYWMTRIHNFSSFITRPKPNPGRSAKQGQMVKQRMGNALKEGAEPDV